MAAVGAIELSGRHITQTVQQSGFVEAVTLMQLLKDVVCAYDGVLDVGTALAFEAERLLEVERNHLAPRELDHEIANRRDTDRPGNAIPLVLVEFRIAGADFTAGRLDERVQQVVGLYAEPFSS